MPINWGWQFNRRNIWHSCKLEPQNWLKLPIASATSCESLSALVNRWLIKFGCLRMWKPSLVQQPNNCANCFRSIALRSIGLNPIGGESLLQNLLRQVGFAWLVQISKRSGMIRISRKPKVDDIATRKALRWTTFTQQLIRLVTLKSWNSLKSERIWSCRSSQENTCGDCWLPIKTAVLGIGRKQRLAWWRS